ncbi:MAG: HAD-IIB family hydrolase [Ruminococcaceae bacterium]|nr:HAD-IIB family hydrolase [Oscillospiraceae bacterium]
MLKALFKDISLKYCLITVLASTALALTLYNVHAQADITEGGILGLSLFFDAVLRVSPAVTTTVANALCYLLGFRVLGRKFIVYSAVGTAGFSLAYAIFEQFPPLFPGIAAYPLIASVTGALLVGVTCGICIRIGGAPSGEDALAMSLSRLLHISIQWVYPFTDFTVLGLSLIYIPFSRIVYSLVSVTLSAQVIGLVQKIPTERKGKAMLSYRIIASDLDGTLLDSHAAVSPENLAAIREMTEMGVFFVPSSGRTLGEIPPCVRDIADARYIIHSDGAVIYDTKAKKPLDTRCMKGENARRALSVFREYESLLTVRYNGVLYIDEARNDSAVYDSYRLPQSYQNQLFHVAVPVPDFDAFCDGMEEIEMICTFFRYDEELAACRERFLADGAYGVAATETTNIELFDKDAGKGNALWRLADILGIPREETIAVGDNINDLDNLSHAGLALAMDNAVGEVKRAAHRTICHNDAHAMEYILKNIITGEATL